jgi:hypothetical protein
LEQLRNRLDVPVGVADVDVAQVGAQLWHFPADVETGTVPLDEPPRRKRVPQILEPWPASDTSTWKAQTYGTGYTHKRPASGPTQQSGATFVDKEGFATALGSAFVSPSRVPSEGKARGVVDRDQARLAELGFPDSENADLEIDIVDV